MTHQPPLPGFEHLRPEGYVCPLCGQPAALFGQYSPLLPWGVCRKCSIRQPYPVEVFVASTRRNRDRNPIMIDPDAPYELRERRMLLDEELRCAVDPTRLERPIVKYNLSALELRNPIRRSRRSQFTQWHAQAKDNLTRQQMQLPFCQRCGCVHDRQAELLPGLMDYKSYCQRCEDEMKVEALARARSEIFFNEDEDALDRLYAVFPELFERGVLPDYWFRLLTNP